MTSAIITPARRYAAFAVALGYTLGFASGDVPSPTIAPTSFVRGRIYVFNTTRGWRIATLGSGDIFLPPQDTDFYQMLAVALSNGAERPEAALPSDPGEVYDRSETINHWRTDYNTATGHGRFWYAAQQRPHLISTFRVKDGRLTSVRIVVDELPVGVITALNAFGVVVPDEYR